MNLLANCRQGVRDQLSAEEAAGGRESFQQGAWVLVVRALHGEATYAQIKGGWTLLAAEKYPQLQALKLS